MMGSRKGKGNLKNTIKSLSSSSSTKSKNSVNGGKGQEVTGVSLPKEENSIKGWEFGNKQRIACFNVEGRYYALQGDCPRCGFDLYKGKIITEDKNRKDLPIVACPTCLTTFSLSTGKHGPSYKASGFFSNFVGDLAKTATASESEKDARAFVVTVDDEDDRVFIRER